MTLRLILMRHGQTHSNLARVIDTLPPGAELTDKGRLQATTAASLIHQTCGDNLQRMYCSVAIRAGQTAVLVNDAYANLVGSDPLRINVRDGLQEINVGELDGRSDMAAHAEFVRVFAGWMRGDATARFPSGENYIDFLDRYVNVLESIDGEGDVLVVSHGSAIRVASAYAGGLSVDAGMSDVEISRNGHLDNAEFVVLEPGDKPFGQWKVHPQPRR